jgi:manganese oxidase
MYVLQQDKAAVLSGAKKPEPFSPLLNVGDCVEYRLTNELPQQYGGTVFDRQEITDEVSIHQHLVQFDVLTSDGSANGWNYDEGADPGQTITYRDFVSSDIKTNSFHDHMYPQTHQDAGLFGGSTIHPAGCKFFDPKTGAPVTVGTIVDVRCEPTTDYHGNVSDGEDYRNAALFIEDHVPMFQPNNPNVARDDKFDTPQGVPIFPAHFPSAHDDSGAMGVNYRLEPFEARRNADPASLFSSRIHGDPETPLPMAYAGDRVKIRLFQLSHEESHGFNMHRFRWKHEPNDPDSNVVQAQHLGMLEYFDLKLPNDKEDANPDGLDLRDYLYYYGGADDWFLGAWGIMRVVGCDVDEKSMEGQAIGAMYGSKTPLMQLPDNPKPSCSLLDMAQKSMFATSGGNPCPTGPTGMITAPIKKFTIVAIKQPLVYNGAGDKDPDGLIYVLEQDLKAVQSGTKKPEPLTIRVNAGDCVEVTLKNQLPKALSGHCYEALEPGQLGFKPPVVGAALPGCLEDIPDSPNEVPGFEPFRVSNRVSLNAKNVDYHVASDGAAVGYNRDSTVGPGGSVFYRWYAPQEGIGLLGDRGDVQNHLHHGLFGALIVEPKGATYLNPKDGTPLASGQEAVVTDPNGLDFREGTILMNSDLSLFKSDGLPVPDNVDLARTPSHEEDDPEDQGEFSIGYKNEPWSTRVGTNPDLSLIFSSVVHGDPATPVFRAYAGDNVRLRVAQAQGDPRATGFTLHGHKWRRAPNDPGSQVAALQAQFNTGVSYNIHLDPNVLGGAGAPGDYLYRSGTLFRHLPGGQWGIFRVLGQKQPDLIGLPDKP